MQLKYVTKTADFHAEVKYNIGNHRASYQRPLGLLLFFLLLGMASVILAERFFAPDFGDRQVISYSWTIGGLLFSLLVAFACFLLAWQAAQQFKQALERLSTDTAGEETSLSFTDEGLKIETANGYRILYWTAIKSVEDYHHAVLIHGRHRLLLRVPGAAFESEGAHLRFIDDVRDKLSSPH